MVDRTQREFSEAAIAKIAGTYHALRQWEGCADVPGFACAATHGVIAGHGYVLTFWPLCSHRGRRGRRRTLRHASDPGGGGQFAGSARLTGAIRRRLARAIVPDERADV